MSDQGGNLAAGVSFASRLTALQNALFSSLIVMSKRTHHHGGFTILGLLIKWLQMMAFLYISAEFNWDKSVSAPIRVLSLIPSPAGWLKVLSPIFLNALFFIAFVWVIAFCGLMVWTVRNFQKGQIPNLTPLKVLASVGQFSATVAYIPLLTMLLSIYVCGNEAQSGTTDQWTPNGYVCMKNGHLALMVLSTIFATVFVGLAALFAMVFYDNHPLSSNLASKVHGRPDFIMLLVKTVLILTIEIFPGRVGGAWALIGINIAAGVMWVGVMLYYMPMMHHRMNALHMALGCLYLWTAICLAIGMSSDVSGAVIVYVGSPVACGVGVYLAAWRRDSVLGKASSKLTSVYEIEMKARFTLVKTVAMLMEQSTAMATKSESAYLVEEEEAAAFPVAVGGLPSARLGTGTTPRGARFQNSSPKSATSNAKGTARRGSARDSRSRRSGDETDFAIFAASFRAMDSEGRERMLKDKVPLKTITECEAMFKNGVMRYPTSAILHMFQSQFYTVFKHDKHLATSHLLLTSRLSPALDVAYLCFQARRAAENAGSSGVLASAMHRVSFDKHLADAKMSTMKAAQAQVSFWQELCDTKPDINQLHKIAAQLSNHTALAETNFKEAFALHPQSLSAMRLFAQYNLSVANNPEKAAAISAEAERIEDQKNKEQNASAGSGSANTGFPFMEEAPQETMTDAVALITVGATSRDLGVIMSANQAACKILGYTRLQLERRNVSVIVPSPFMESHDNYMRRYLSTGEGIFVETVRTNLAKHRNGHLVPLSIMIKETTMTDNTPIFHGTLRPINFTDHVIQMDEDWVVMGGTAGALMALQVDAATLSASEVCMADYCPMLNDSEAVTDLMGRAQGDVVQMRLPGFASGDDDHEGSTQGNPSLQTGGHGKAGRGIPALDGMPLLPLNGGGSERVDPWSKAMDVKATLMTYTIHGNNVNILTFRMLSTNEQAQRANAKASRRASIAAGESVGRPMSAAPSFRRSVSPGAGLGRSMGASGSRDDSGSEGGRGEIGNDSVALTMHVATGSISSDSLPMGHPAMTAAAFAGGSCPVMAGRRSRSPPQESEHAHALRVPSIGRLSRLSGTPMASGSGKLKKKAGSVRISQQEAEVVEVEASYKDDDSVQMATEEDGGSEGEGQARSGWGAPAEESAVVVVVKPAVKPAFKSRLSRQNSKDGRVAIHADEDEKERRRRASIADGKGSVRSGGSSSKRSSVGRNTLNKLRRIIAESAVGSGTTKGVPGLSLLYLTGWLLLILNMGLGVLSAVLLDANFVDYARNLRFASVAGIATQQQSFAMRLLIQTSLINRGWLTATPEQTAAYSVEMAKVADLCSSSTSRMYSLVDGTDRSSFFTAPVLEYVDFTDSVPEPAGRVSVGVVKAMLQGKNFWPWSLSNGDVLVGVRRKTTLLDFSASWAGTLKQLANKPSQNITKNEAQVLFVVANTQAGAPAHEYIRRAIFESYLASEDSEKLVTTLVLWIFVAMGPLLCTILLTIVIPILLYIDHKRDNIMESFLDLPTLIVMYLRAGAERRLRSLRCDEEGGDDSEDDEEDEETRRALALGLDNDNPDLELDDGTVDWEAIFVRVAVEANRAEKKRLKKLIPTPSSVSARSNTSKRYIADKAAQAAGCCASTRSSDASKKAAVHHRSMCSRGTRAPGGYYRSVVNADGSVSTFIRKDYKKSSKSFVNLAVFLVPLLLMFVFYLVLYLVTMDTVHRVIAMSAFTSLSAMRSAALLSSLNSVMYQVATPGYQPEEDFRYEYTAQKIVDVVATNKLLVYNIRTYAQAGVDGGIGPSLDYTKSDGSESSSVPGMPADAMARVRGAQDKDACPYIQEALEQSGGPALDMDACRKFNGGVLTSGLQAGLQDYVRRLRRLRDRRRSADVPVNTTDGMGVLSTTTSSEWGNAFEGTSIDEGPNGLSQVADGGSYVDTSSSAGSGSPSDPLTGLNSTVTTLSSYSIKGELRSEDFETADYMLRNYLLPSFTYTSELYGEAGVRIVTEYRIFLMAFVGGFLSLYVLGTLFLYLPAINTLAKDVQSKRAMLLLLPAPVIAKLPSLRAMVLQIVAEHESGGASAMASANQADAADAADDAPPAADVPGQ